MPSSGFLRTTDVSIPYPGDAKPLTYLIMTKSIAIATLCMALVGCAAHLLSSDENLQLHQAAIDTQHGTASWYNIRTNHGTHTASGRPLENDAFTAAHREWPMGSKVRVTNLDNGRSEILTITDRGPYTRGRVIDVTVGSAKRLGFYQDGLTRTKIELLSRGDWKYQH